MTVLSVFLHAVMALTLGPVVLGLVRIASMPARGWRERFAVLVEPSLSLNKGMRAPGQPDVGAIARLSLAGVAALLIPFFSPDAVLGFLGDGFTALLLLAGLSIGVLPLRAASVMALAGGLWALGALTGTTDLAAATAALEPSLATGLIFVALALGVAPMLAPCEALDGNTPPSPPSLGQEAQMGFARAKGGEGDALNAALRGWSTGTLQLGWLALGAMAFPWSVPVTSGLSLAAALGFFFVKLALLGGVLAHARARWPRLPLAEAGLAAAALALVLVTLGF